MSNISRRKFIEQASCAAIGSTTLLSSILNLGMFNALASPTNSSDTDRDYKALVCILLAGGNDSFNMLIPRGTSEYNEYAATRSGLAIPKNELHNINPLSGTGGKLFGLHPSMEHVQELFEEGELAFLSNVGTLVEPITNAQQYNSGIKKVPLGLFSHSDQIEQWQTSVPQNRNAVGWGGRMADILHTLNTNNTVSMNISLSGSNVFQSGNLTYEYTISNQGSGIEGLQPFQDFYSNRGFLDRTRNAAVDSLVADTYYNVFQKTIARVTRQSIDAQKHFEEAINMAPTFTTQFHTSNLSQSMQMIARVAAVHEQLGVKRQTFFVSYGGWDHHDEVLESQLVMLNILSRALADFNSALKEIGLHDQVTTFTISDFGRTLTSNGNGSDHAWGSNQIIMGGAVKGQRLYGQYPDLYLTGNPLVVTKRGVLLPTTSADAFFAELALWFGVSQSDLALVLPNIRNFYPTGSTTPPIGFMNI